MDKYATVMERNDRRYVALVYWDIGAYVSTYVTKCA